MTTSGHHILDTGITILEEEATSVTSLNMMDRMSDDDRTKTRSGGGTTRYSSATMGLQWSFEEDEELKRVVAQLGPNNWRAVSDSMSLLGRDRTDVHCLHRWSKVLRPGLQKGGWTPQEDDALRELVRRDGVANVKWATVALQLPGRIGKQCRERWFNHLDPTIKKSEWETREDLILLEGQRVFGNRWSEIAKVIPGRAENTVKNRWNSSTYKRWMHDHAHMPGPDLSPYDLSSCHGSAVAFQQLMGALARRGVRLDEDIELMLIRASQEGEQILGHKNARINSSSNLHNHSATASSVTTGLPAAPNAPNAAAGGASMMVSEDEPNHYQPHQPSGRRTLHPSQMTAHEASAITAATTASTSSSSSSYLPPHLRPSSIKTRVEEVRGDPSSLQIAEILNLLKSATTHKNDMADFNANTGSNTGGGGTGANNMTTSSSSSSAMAPHNSQHQQQQQHSYQPQYSYQPQHQQPYQHVVHLEEPHEQYQQAPPQHTVLSSELSSSAWLLEAAEQQEGLILGLAPDSDELVVALDPGGPNFGSAGGSNFGSGGAGRIVMPKKRGRPSKSETHNSSSNQLKNKAAKWSRDKNSPTFSAVERVCASPLLVIGAGEEAPLQLLPYFKFLNEYAQMSLMRQLIDKFERTSFTPRNYVMMPTPRLDFDRALGGYEVDPNCFDGFSPRGASSRNIGGGGGDVVATTSSTSESAQVGENGVSHAGVCGGAVSGGAEGVLSSSTIAAAAHKDSNSSSDYHGTHDGSSVEAAVTVALQVASGATSASELLSLLLGNGNIALIGSSSRDTEDSNASNL